MNFEEFVNRIKESIRDYLPREYENAEVLVQEQQKLNNRYNGLLEQQEFSLAGLAKRGKRWFAKRKKGKEGA